MIKWDAIETVLLDMDGTLLDLHFDNYFWLHHLPERYAALNDSDPDDCRRQLMARYESMRGTLDWYCLDYWTDNLGIDVVALKQEVAHKICLRPGAEDFLVWLREQGKQVVLVTNAHPHSLDLKMAQIPIAQHFDELISSHQFHTPKEQMEFWHALQKHRHFDPRKTLFIDDTEVVLSSAASFGVAHLWSVLQPDLQQPVREPGNFPGFNHFAEIFTR